ncbi:MAG: ClpP family protease [Peptostreptococcaceae bacterium]
MADLQIGSTDKIVDKAFEDSLKDRKIILNEIIDESTFERTTMQIMKFNKEDKGLPVEARKPIIIYINSNGGEIDNGLALIDVIKQSKTPVYGVVVSYAYSMGGIILVACHKRIAFKHSTVLVHDGSGGAYGSTGKVKDQIKFLEKLDAAVKDIVVGHTKITSEKYDEMYDREWYIMGDELKDLGIIDMVVGEDIDIDEII